MTITEGRRVRLVPVAHHAAPRIRFSQRRWLAFAVATMSMLAVGSYRLTTAPLDWDEGATLSTVDRSVPEIIDLAKHVDAVITPYYLYLKVIVSLFGDSDLVLRLPSLIAVSIGVGLIAELGRRLISAAAGITAGFICALMPALSHFCLSARPYGTVFCLVALATLLLYRALDQPSWQRWIGYAVCVMFSGLFHFVSLSMLAGHLVIVAGRWYMSRDRRLLRVLPAVVTALALIAPLAYLGTTQRTTQLFWVLKPTFATVRSAPGDIAFNSRAGYVLVVLAIVAAFLLARRTYLELLAMAVLPVAFVMLVSVVTTPVWVARYGTFVLGPLAILGGAVTQFARRPARLAVPVATNAIRFGAAAVVVAALGVFTVADHNTIRSSRNVPDSRRLASIVLDGSEPGDAVVYGGGASSVRATFSHYLAVQAKPDQTIPADPLVRKSAAQIGQLNAEECEQALPCLTGVGRIWLVTSVPPGENTPFNNGTLRLNELRACYDVAETWVMTPARLTLLLRKTGAGGSPVAGCS